MDIKNIEKALLNIRESNKRKFSQSIDLIVKLKGYSVKTDGEINMIVKLNKSVKETKICSVVGPELLDDSKKCCEKVLTDKELEKITPKEAKKIARDFDFFIAQIQLMPQLAKKMGRILGPLGKMPNPKKGQVLSPKSNVKEVVQKLKNSVKISTNKQNVIAVKVGNENTDNSEIIENIKIIIEAIKNNMPSQQGVINELILKTTMGKPVKIK